MTDNTAGPAGLPSQVTYEPLPSIYRAFAAGATPYAIITETIDNSIDFVRRQALNDEHYPDTLKVDIRFDPIEEESETENEDTGGEDSTGLESTESASGRLIITDNAGGVPPEELAKFFQLGHSDAPPEGIGRFGVGAKRLIGIGNHIRYESHAYGRDIGAGFEVDAQKLEGEAADSSRSTYSSDVYEVDDLEAGKTRIIVEDLNKGVWERLCGVKEEAINRNAEDSLWRLKETYEHFLRDDIQINPHAERREGHIEFDLSWGVRGVESSDVPSGEETLYEVAEDVSPPDQVGLSYVSFDGLWPRKYSGMPFANDPETPVEECLRVDIEVGLMPSSDPEEAGLTVTMNNRNVLFRDTDNDLFSSRYLGKFRESAGHGRLHCIVSVHGEAEDMPWSDTKDSLDGTQQVTEEILNVTENALKEYRRQTYDNLPDWILEVYSIESLKRRGYYDNEGIRTDIERISKDNSKVNSPRFNQKPGETSTSSSYRQYPIRDTLIRTANLHAALRIRCDSGVDEVVEPAYSNYFETTYDGPEPQQIDASRLPDVDEYAVPLRSDSEDEIPLIEDIKNLAKEHATEGERLSETTDGVPVWLLPRYREELKAHAEPEGLTSIDSFDLAAWREQHSVSEEVRVEAPLQEPRPSSEEGQRSRDQIHQRRGGRSHGEEQDSTEGLRSTPSSTDAGESVEQRESQSSVEPAGAASRSQRDLETFAQPRSSRPTAPESGISYNEEEYEASEEEMTDLLEHLDLDSEATPEEIFQELNDALEQRERLIEQLDKLSELVNIEALLDEPIAIEQDGSE